MQRFSFRIGGASAGLLLGLAVLGCGPSTTGKLRQTASSPTTTAPVAQAPDAAPITQASYAEAVGTRKVTVAVSGMV